MPAPASAAQGTRKDKVGADQAQVALTPPASRSPLAGLGLPGLIPDPPGS